jgi:hypothetical protein
MEDEPTYLPDIAPEYWLLKERFPNLPVEGAFTVSGKAVKSIPCAVPTAEGIDALVGGLAATYRGDEEP